MKKFTLGLFWVLNLWLCISCFRRTTDQSQETKTDKKHTHNSELLSSNFNIKSLEDLYQFLTHEEEHKYPLVSAHRGGDHKGYPENAIETFAYWADQFPLIIECDVRLSKDSVLVLMHDDTLDRTSNGKGKINEHTWKELKGLRLKDPEGNLTDYKIPTLEDVLNWGKGKVLFTLDVKQDVPYTLLSKIIEKSNAQASVIVITYNTAQARAMNRVNPDLMLSVSIKSQKDIIKLAEAGIPDNRLVAFVGIAEADTELMELLHAHGIKIILGTLGNLDRQAKARGYQVYAEFIDNGADILSTDNPADAQKALDFYIHKRNLTSPFIKK